MSAVISTSAGRRYGVARVCRTWGVARSSLYRGRVTEGLVDELLSALLIMEPDDMRQVVGHAAEERRAFLNPGPVVDRQQDQLQVVDAPGVDLHEPATDLGEVVNDVEVVEGVVVGQHVLKQAAQRGDVPLAVAEFVDRPSQSPRGLCLKQLVECLVRRLDAEVEVQNEERVMRGVHDLLDVDLLTFELLSREFPIGEVLDRQQDLVAPSVPRNATRVQHDDPAAEERKLMLDPEVSDVGAVLSIAATKGAIYRRKMGPRSGCRGRSGACAHRIADAGQSAPAAGRH